jgi:uncharacterized protein YecE (DUF72 family)
VEIDSTFYGTPKKSTIQHWIDATPKGFKFSCKVPRVITHDEGVVNVWGLMAEFLDVIQLLGDRLGVILFQFPPSFTSVHINRLAEFLPKLPTGLRFAIEVRDRSWHTDEEKFNDLLTQYRLAWAATQYPNLPAKIHSSSDFIYVRWIGQHGAFQQHNQERINRLPDLEHWWQYIQTFAGLIPELYGYFNNDYAGFAAGTALKFKKMIGQPVDFPPKTHQARLF